MEARAESRWQITQEVDALLSNPYNIIVMEAPRKNTWALRSASTTTGTTNSGSARVPSKK